MNITDSIAIYTSSQKIVGMSFIVLGALLIGVFFCLLFQQSLASQLWQGFKISALVCGLLIASGGIGYFSFCNKTQAELFSMHEKEPTELIQFEKQRIQKVVRDYPIYQMAFALIVGLSLGVIVLGRDYWIGIAFPVAILFLCVMLIEAHSKDSIVKHDSFVQNITKDT